MVPLARELTGDTRADPRSQRRRRPGSSAGMRERREPAAFAIGGTATGNRHAPSSRRYAPDIAQTVPAGKLVGIDPGFGCGSAVHVPRYLDGSASRRDGAAASGEHRARLACFGIHAVAFAVWDCRDLASSCSRTGPLEKSGALESAHWQRVSNTAQLAASLHGSTGRDRRCGAYRHGSSRAKLPLPDRVPTPDSSRTSSYVSRLALPRLTMPRMLRPDNTTTACSRVFDHFRA